MFDKHKGSSKGGQEAKAADAGTSMAGDKTPSFTPNKTGTIGPGISITGDIKGEENLVIEGTVKGRVELADHEVTIGKTGRLNADVVAKIVRIDGNVEGDVVGNERVLISRTGNVEGNIVAPRLILEDGALFRGSVEMSPPQAEPAESAKTVQNAPSAKPEPMKATKAASKPAAKPVAVDSGKKEPGFAAKGG